MTEVEVVHHYVHADPEVLPVVYAEDNPLWILVGLLLTGAVLVIIGVLATFYIAGVWLARRVERWAEGRAR